MQSTVRRSLKRAPNTNGNTNRLLASAPSVSDADAILAKFGYVEKSELQAA